MRNKLPKAHINVEPRISILGGSNFYYIVRCFKLISKVILFFTEVSLVFVFYFNGKKIYVGDSGVAEMGE